MLGLYFQVTDELTAPRNLEVTQTGQYSIAISWEPPECGFVGEYHIEVGRLFSLSRKCRIFYFSIKND